MNEQEKVSGENEGSIIHVLVAGEPIVFESGFHPAKFILTKDEFVVDLAHLAGVEVDDVAIQSIQEQGLPPIS